MNGVLVVTNENKFVSKGLDKNEKIGVAPKLIGDNVVSPPSPESGVINGVNMSLGPSPTKEVEDLELEVDGLGSLPLVSSDSGVLKFPHDGSTKHDDLEDCSSCKPN